MLRFIIASGLSVNDIVFMYNKYMVSHDYDGRLLIVAIV